MYCKNCGKPIEEDSVFCPNCGTNVNSKKAQALNQSTNREGGIPGAAVGIVMGCGVLIVTMIVITVLAVNSKNTAAEILKIQTQRSTDVVSNSSGTTEVSNPSEPDTTNADGVYEIGGYQVSKNSAVLAVDGNLTERANCVYSPTEYGEDLQVVAYDPSQGIAFAFQFPQGELAAGKSYGLEDFTNGGDIAAVLIWGFGSTIENDYSIPWIMAADPSSRTSTSNDKFSDIEFVCIDSGENGVGQFQYKLEFQDGDTGQQHSAEGYIVTELSSSYKDYEVELGY